MVKNTAIELLLNVIGAVLAFLLFAFDPFIVYLMGGEMLLMPFWAWGILGVAAFEGAMWFFVYRKK